MRKEKRETGQQMEESGRGRGRWELGAGRKRERERVSQA